PTSVFRGEDELEPVPDPFGLPGLEGLIEGGRVVGLEIVHHQDYLLGPGTHFVRYPLYKMCPIVLGLVLVHLHHAVAPQGLIGHEYVDHSVPDVFIIGSGRPSGGHRDTGPRIGDRLLWRFVHADRRMLPVIGSLVDIQHLFHGRDQPAVGLWGDHPPLYFPGLEFVFFRMFPTDTWEMLSTYSSSTILSANSRRDHLANPGGGSLQHRWTSLASTSPSSFTS